MLDKKALANARQHAYLLTDFNGKTLQENLTLSISKELQDITNANRSPEAALDHIPYDELCLIVANYLSKWDESIIDDFYYHAEKILQDRQESKNMNIIILALYQAGYGVGTRKEKVGA